MAICLLSEREAANLERHSLPPSCQNHRHLPYHKAEQLERDQSARWTSTFPSRLVLLPPRVWRPIKSTLQLVEGVIQGRKGHFGCPTPASGARGRNTSVWAMNNPQRQRNSEFITA